MNSPYTSQPLDAFATAETAVAATLGALIVLWPLRTRAASALLFGAITVAALAPTAGTLLRDVGVPVGDAFVRNALELSAALATISALLARRRATIIAAAAGEALLFVLTNVLSQSDSELAVLHLAFYGLLVGVHRHGTGERLGAARADGDARATPLWREDAAAFAAGVILGFLACWVLLHGRTGSGDEWADTYQAALFAKGHAYAAVPTCADAFRSFWVFQYDGRSFAQYTPGWPYFMTPFIWIRAPWLAGPTSLGVLAAGVGRLGRRAAAEASAAPFDPSSPFARAAGRLAVAALLSSSTVVINGGSRYPHLFVAGMFAWAVEAVCSLAADGVSTQRQWRWGIALGVAVALLVAARPGDGVTLSFGVGVYFVIAAARRRVGWRGATGAALSGAAISALTLVILRLQVGRWGATGYSLTAQIYPWAKVAWSLPKPNEYKLAIPLAAGAYCWFPCSPAVALAGLGALGGRARRLPFMFCLGVCGLLTFYTLVTLGRAGVPGYGPRYILPCIVPMAVGTGVALSAAWQAARAAGARRASAAAAICGTALAIGVVHLAVLLYPPAFNDSRAHNKLKDAIAASGVHHAVVFAEEGVSNIDSMDLTENLPLEFYPEQDVLVAIDHGPKSVRCVRKTYPKRTYYRATRGDPVKIAPY